VSNHAGYGRKTKTTDEKMKNKVTSEIMKKFVV